MSEPNYMSRRRFCAIAAAMAAAPLAGRASVIAGDAAGERPWQATVVRCGCDEELQSILLSDPETGPCARFRTGQTFAVRPGSPAPAGICPAAWSAICAAIAGPCAATTSGTCVEKIAVSCPDATRPVIFLLTPA